MKTPLHKLIEYLESKDYDHDLISAAIVAVEPKELILQEILNLLAEETQNIIDAYEAGGVNADLNGEEYFEFYYNREDEQDTFL